MRCFIIACLLLLVPAAVPGATAADICVPYTDHYDHPAGYRVIGGTLWSFAGTPDKGEYYGSWIPIFCSGTLGDLGGLGDIGDLADLEAWIDGPIRP